MNNKILIAEEGKVFAYKDKEGKENILGSILYLGKNDDGSRYYQIEEIKEVEQDDRYNDTN